MNLENRYLEQHGRIYKILSVRPSGYATLEDKYGRIFNNIDIHFSKELNNPHRFKNGYFLLPEKFNPNKKHYEIYY